MFFNKILNNKGSILPVTVTAMVVIMVAGLACLKMFSVQNTLNNYDRVKVRLNYAAMGAVEICRAAISSAENTNDYTAGTNDANNSGYYNNYDATGYPNIGYYVTKRASSASDLSNCGLSYGGAYSVYKITGTARAQFVSPDDGKKRTFSVTVYYFYAQNGTEKNKYFIGWSKSPMTVS